MSITSCLLSLVAGADPLVLQNARVIDVTAGTVRLQDVTVRGGVIHALSAPGAETANGTAVDLGRRYLIPGLWDMHVHFEGRDLVEDNALLLPVYLAYGITGVRDAASNLAKGATRAVHAVVYGGEWLNRARLDALPTPRRYASWTTGVRRTRRRPYTWPDLNLASGRIVIFQLDG
jgi:predicted amidohydrolase YtcJ